MSNESDRIKRELRERLSGLSSESSFNTLGLTRELVTQLDDASLSVAVKGVARALMMSLHPDRSTGTNLAGAVSERLQAVKSAEKSILDNPNQARKSYLQSKSSVGRANKKQLPVGKTTAETREYEAREQLSKETQVRAFERMYSPESVVKIKNANIFLNLTRTTVNKGGDDTSHISIHGHDGQFFVVPMAYVSSLHINDKILSNPDQAFDDTNAMTGIYKEDASRSLFVSEHASESLANIKHDDIKEGWWYTLRGYQEEHEDHRSIQSYRPIGLAQEIKLLGCVDEKTESEIKQGKVHAATMDTNEVIYSIAEGTVQSTPTIPLWQREQNILNHRWKDLITYTYPDKYSFDPVLQSGMYLIGELEDGRKISLGQIDLMRADYY